MRLIDAVCDETDSLFPKPTKKHASSGHIAFSTGP